MNDIEKIAKSLSLLSRRIGHIMPGQAIVLLPNHSMLVIPLEQESEQRVAAPAPTVPSSTAATVPSAPTLAPESGPDMSEKDDDEGDTVKFQEGEIPSYHRDSVVQVVEVLLRKDVLPVGRTIRALTTDLGYGRSKLEKLVRMALPALPFLMKNGSLAPIRIRPGMVKDAEAWLKHCAENVEPPKVVTGMSDETFISFGTKVVYALLKYPGGANTTVLVQETGLNSGALQRFRQHQEMTSTLPFLRIEPPPVRGSPALLAITDFAAAEAWLDKHTDPAEIRAD